MHVEVLCFVLRNFMYVGTSQKIYLLANDDEMDDIYVRQLYSLDVWVEYGLIIDKNCVSIGMTFPFRIWIF